MDFESATYGVEPAVGQVGGGYRLIDQTPGFDKFADVVDDVLGDPLKPMIDLDGARKAGWDCTPSSTVLFCSELEKSSKTRPGAYRSRLLATHRVEYERRLEHISIIVRAGLGEDLDAVVAGGTCEASYVVDTWESLIARTDEAAVTRLAECLKSLADTSRAEISCAPDELLIQLSLVVSFLPEPVVADTFLSVEAHPKSDRVRAFLDIHSEFDTSSKGFESFNLIDAIEQLLLVDGADRVLLYMRSRVPNLAEVAGFLAWSHASLFDEPTPSSIRFESYRGELVALVGNLLRKGRPRATDALAQALVIDTEPRSQLMYISEFGAMLSEQIAVGNDGAAILADAHTRGIGWEVIIEAHRHNISPGRLGHWFTDLARLSGKEYILHALLWRTGVDVTQLVRGCEERNPLLVSCILLSRARVLDPIDRRMLGSIHKNMAIGALSLMAEDSLLDENVLATAVQEYSIVANDASLVTMAWSNDLLPYDRIGSIVAEICGSNFSGSWQEFVEQHGDEYLLVIGVPEELLSLIKARRGRPKLGRAFRRGTNE